jgi:hypothetical protein
LEGIPAMSDRPTNPDSEYRHHDAAPGAAPDRSAHAAVPDSFPASDPVATTAAVGSRAVDPAEMMRPRVEIHGAATVAARFPHQEGAKLALERLVREIPLDRRGASIRCGDDGATLEVVAPGADTGRIAEMLRRCGGQGC